MNMASMFHHLLALGVNDPDTLEKALHVFSDDVTSVAMLDSGNCPGIPDGGASIIVCFSDWSILMSIADFDRSLTKVTKVLEIPPPENEREKLLQSALGLAMVALMKANTKDD